MDAYDVGSWLIALGALLSSGFNGWMLWEQFKRGRSYVYLLPVAAGVVSVVMATASTLLYRSREPVMVAHQASRSASPRQIQHLDLIQKTLRGSVVVSTPNTATQFKSFKVELRLAPERLEPLLAAMRAEAPVGAAVVGKEGIWLSPVMEASVYGSGFEFEPKDKQAYSQMVASKEPTSWTWQVTPMDAGALMLTFKLSGKLQPGGQDDAVGRDFYDESFTVSVAVNPEGFFKRNWKDLLAMLGASIVALMGALWAYFTWLRPKP